MISARFMLCTADYAIIAIVNLPVLFGQSLPCFEVFFYNNVIKKVVLS